jgi:transporter family-2 protein
LMSLLIDHFGWLNNAERALDGSRYLAMVLLLLAIVLIYLSHRRSARPAS